MKIIIVSGRSGSGKSISLHLLEDLGYYCIDNLPATLLPILLERIALSYDKIAIGIDARNLPQDLDQFHSIIEKIRQIYANCEILYLDAEDSTLIKRFNETRRKHPLSNQNISLAEAILKEKKLLEPIAHMADLYVDTSQYTLHQLRDNLASRIDKHNKHVSLLIQSFGYKFGIPIDSDFTFDVRCLSNPYWQIELRQFTGLEEPIITYLSEIPESAKMINDIIHFLNEWIPEFEANNRTYMTVSIGCTGGQHRSVYIAQEIFNYFHAKEKHVQIRHRELL